MAELLYSRMKDIMFGYDTDIHFEKGDLMLTSTGTDFIEREIYKILVTERGQWGANQQLGASPVVFAGEPNTREVANDLEQYIQDGLKFAVSPSGSILCLILINFPTSLALK